MKQGPNKKEKNTIKVSKGQLNGQITTETLRKGKNRKDLKSLRKRNWRGGELMKKNEHFSKF